MSTAVSQTSSLRTTVLAAAVAVRTTAADAVEARRDADHERGANLVEYALLMAFIAAVCVAAVALLGPTTAQPFSNLNNSGLGG